MTGLRTKLLATVLGYSGAYAVLAAALLIRPIPELNTGVIWSLPLVWIAWHAHAAIGHVAATITDHRTRRRARHRLAQRLDGYHPGAALHRPHHP